MRASNSILNFHTSGSPWCFEAIPEKNRYFVLKITPKVTEMTFFTVFGGTEIGEIWPSRNFDFGSKDFFLEALVFADRRAFLFSTTHVAQFFS